MESDSSRYAIVHLFPLARSRILTAHEPAVLSYILCLWSVKRRLLLGFSKFLLNDVAAPPCHSGDGKNRGHQVPGNTHHVVERSTEKIDIGLNLRLPSFSELLQPGG